MDLSKIAFAKVTHRALFHHTLGPLIMEQMFGVTITNADGIEVCVRDIAEQHITDDLGFIPTVEQWLAPLPCELWMAGLHTRPLKIVDDSAPEKTIQFVTPGPEEKPAPGEELALARTRHRGSKTVVQLGQVPALASPPTDDPPCTLASQLADRR